MDKNPPKVYTHGAIGQSEQIALLFKKLNVNNPLEYRFNDPWVIYYVDRHNNISVTEPNTDLYHFISTSGEWKELKLRVVKRERKFLVTLKEGCGSCDGCQVLNKCSETQKKKCQLAALLSDLTDSELTGKVLNIEEIGV